MNMCIVKEKYTRGAQEFLEKMEHDFQPYTLKNVSYTQHMGNAFMHFFDFLFGEKKTLYLHENDDVIDKKSIENDIAVVSKDFMIAMKKYDDKSH